MNLSSIEGIKTARDQGFLTTKGAIYCILQIKEGARPVELEKWLELPASTIYANLRTMEVSKKVIEWSVSLADNGQIIRERPGAVYAVQ